MWRDYNWYACILKKEIGGTEMEIGLYHYMAKIRSVYDADTCTVDIDLGLGTWLRGEKIRLYGINAPEMRGPEKPRGTVSRDFLRGKIARKTVLLETLKLTRKQQDERRSKKGKFGRYLATVWLEETKDTWTNINDLLVQQGYAVYKNY